MTSAAKKSAHPSSSVTYVDDVFSTYLYTGNGSTQTINNGIDLAGKGGLVWSKVRNNIYNHLLADTETGIQKRLQSNLTNAQDNGAGVWIDSALSNGFSLGYGSQVNASSNNYASWTFRKAAKFFDVVTWVGNNDVGTSIGQGIIHHNLGVAPGMVILKNTTQGLTNWIVYHRSLSGGYHLLLNTTDAQTNTSSISLFSKYVSNTGWVQTDPDATNIYVGYNYQSNGVGDTMVAYLFAHNAGGFGLTGTDNVISCNAFDTNGSGQVSVTLGYEPQYLLVKRIDSTGDWLMLDNMRGLTADLANSVATLRANLSNAETAAFTGWGINATGFYWGAGAASASYIYLAIRRPNKPPTSGTQVYNGIARTGTGAAANVTGVGFAPDLAIIRNRTDVQDFKFTDRLRGIKQALVSDSTAAEGTDVQGVTALDLMDGLSVGTDLAYNKSATGMANWFFKRAPGFMDVVCYTGVGYPTALTVNHNLGVAPEMMIVKKRSATQSWFVYHSAMGNDQEMYLNQAASQQPTTYDWNSTTPSATTFAVNAYTNNSGATYVAYLFATCAGVSKVGSYTGNGTSQTINCGFAAGARFILIKCTSTTGDWLLWDSARGIVAGNDPTLALNSTAAEVTGTDCIDPDSSGFIVNQESTNNLNVNGATYIYFSVA